jgi:hypothetical protein
MHAWVWVIEHNGCGVVSRNVGRLINGKWEIDVISLRDGVGSDWNRRGICGLDANGIDSDVTGDGIAGGNGGWVGGRELHGVRHDGVEVKGLVDLHCPVKACGLVLGRCCSLPFSCICLSFARSILFLHSHFLLLFSPYCGLFVISLFDRRCIIRVRGSGGRGGCFELELVWDGRWRGDDVARVYYAIESFRHCGVIDGVGGCNIGCGNGGGSIRLA